VWSLHRGSTGLPPMAGEDHEAIVDGNTKYCLRTAVFPILTVSSIRHSSDRRIRYPRIFGGRHRRTRKCVISAAKANIVDSVPPSTKHFLRRFAGYHATGYQSAPAARLASGKLDVNLSWALKFGSWLWPK